MKIFLLLGLGFILFACASNTITTKESLPIAREVATAGTSAKNLAGPDLSVKPASVLMVGPESRLVLVHRDRQSDDKFFIDECDVMTTTIPVQSPSDCAVKSRRPLNRATLTAILRYAFRLSPIPSSAKNGWEELRSDYQKKLVSQEDGRKLKAEKARLEARITQLERIVENYGVAEGSKKEIEHLRAILKDVEGRQASLSEISQAFVAFELVLNSIVSEWISSSEVRVLRASAADESMEANILHQLLKNQFIPGEFVAIPAGDFKIKDSESRNQDRQIRLTKGFEIGATEVTQLQWASIMAYNPSSKVSDCGLSEGIIFVKERYVNLCADHPVTGLTNADITDFLNALNILNRDGYFYRLPTSAEWEYAALGGFSGTIDELVSAKYLDDVAWHSKRFDSDLQPVATRLASGFGLYDMFGNVSELVQDWSRMDRRPWQDSDPIIAHNPVDNFHGQILRGGSFLDSSTELSRFVSRQNFQTIRSARGFRLVREKRK